MKDIKLWRVLGFAGLIPFVACTWLYSIGIMKLGVSIVYVFTCYSAIILSFMSGSIWLQQHDEKVLAPTVLSNLFSLLAFLCLLLEPRIALSVLAVAYLLLLIFEVFYDLFKDKPSEYKSMRIWLTIVVVLCHALILSSL